MSHPAPDSAPPPADGFEPHRPMLTGLAYRMLGSVAEAEDVVQDAYLRWHRADRSRVADPRAFLARTVTRLCLDHLKSARARREQYVGPWLPEPLIDAPAPTTTHDDAEALAADVSTALLVALQRLSPLERAAFLLHDVFGVDFASIAAALDRDPAACRQLAARARDHVRAARPRFRPSAADVERLAAAFMQAVADNDASALTQLLRADAVLHTDGGGRTPSALHPIAGRDKLIRFVLTWSSRLAHVRLHAGPINGTPGFVATHPDGRRDVVTFDVTDGTIAAVFVVSNPEKLRHLRT